METPRLGRNRLQSFVEFITNLGLTRFGAEGKRLFFQDTDGNTNYLTNEDGNMQYQVFTDGSGTYGRIGVRSSKMVVDITLTATGFDGKVDVDWENVVTF